MLLSSCKQPNNDATTIVLFCLLFSHERSYLMERHSVEARPQSALPDNHSLVNIVKCIGTAVPLVKFTG
jgi:hypothetical protein